MMMMDMDNDSQINITSDFTIDSVMTNFRDIIIKRYEFFRNLCTFINIISRFNDKVQISRHVADEINSRYFELSFNNLSSYHFLKWLSEIYPFYVSKTKL